MKSLEGESRHSTRSKSSIVSFSVPTKSTTSSMTDVQYHSAMSSVGSTHTLDEENGLNYSRDVRLDTFLDFLLETFPAMRQKMKILTGSSWFLKIAFLIASHLETFSAI